jgi:hypothetical protein
LNGKALLPDHMRHPIKPSLCEYPPVSPDKQGTTLGAAIKDDRLRLSTHQKALKINLDVTRYGTFAEIGAGQEVARWFFRVGAAAGTIAKSISAYDMAVSDAIYGPCKRYVSRERLQCMLDYEHGLNLERLGSSRGNTAFFAFADTVSARNYHGTNECHGWIGVKFQAYPRGEDNQIVIHVRMLDEENSLQQEALGVVGVNLLYAAFFLHQTPELMLESLLDNLSTERIEIDMVEFSGVEFRYVDSRVMSLRLVQLGLTGAAMFGASGEVLQPLEVLRKRPILIERGRFRPVTKVNIDMMNCARERFAAEPEVDGSKIVELMEITMRSLWSPDFGIDLEDFLARADLLATTGKIVLISDYFEYYRLAAYLTRYTNEPIALTIGAASLRDLFTEQYYADLEGGILEAFGKLFTKNLRIYVYPLLDQSTGLLTTVGNIEISADLRSLYLHLVERGRIKQLDNFDRSVLHIFSPDVLKRIKDNDASWEDMVPQKIAALIKRGHFFGYRESKIPEETSVERADKELA